MPSNSNDPYTDRPRALPHALTHARTHALPHARTHARSRTHAHAHIHTFTHSHIYSHKGDGSAGLWADDINLAINVSLVNPGTSAGDSAGGSAAGPRDVNLVVELMDAAGKVVLKPAPIWFTFPAGADPAAAVEVQFKLSVPRAELWSIPRPYLYTLTVAVADASSGAINDEVTMPVGLRLGNFTERDGYELNGQRVRRTDVERFF